MPNPYGYGKFYCFFGILLIFFFCLVKENILKNRTSNEYGNAANEYATNGHESNG